VQIEKDVIGSGLADHTNGLALFNRESLSRVALDDRLADYSHRNLHAWIF
jgi:hypothetical protein